LLTSALFGGQSLSSRGRGLVRLFVPSSPAMRPSGSSLVHSRNQVRFIRCFSVASFNDASWRDPLPFGVNLKAGD